MRILYEVVEFGRGAGLVTLLGIELAGDAHELVSARLDLREAIPLHSHVEGRKELRHLHSVDVS